MNEPTTLNDQTAMKGGEVYGADEKDSGRASARSLEVGREIKGNPRIRELLPGSCAGVPIIVAAARNSFRGTDPQGAGKNPKAFKRDRGRAMQPELTDQTAIDRIRKCAAKLESNGGPIAKQWAGALYEAAEYAEKRMQQAVTVRAEEAEVRITVADGGTVNFYERG